MLDILEKIRDSQFKLPTTIPSPDISVPTGARTMIDAGSITPRTVGTGKPLLDVKIETKDSAGTCIEIDDLSFIKKTAAQAKEFTEYRVKHVEGEITELNSIIEKEKKTLDNLHDSSTLKAIKEKRD